LGLCSAKVGLVSASAWFDKSVEKAWFQGFFGILKFAFLLSKTGLEGGVGVSSITLPL
jgi:hypothetical protein